MRPLPFLVALAMTAATASGGPSAAPLTLEQALAEAEAANARLPVAALSAEISAEKIREARAERWLNVALESAFLYAPPSGYDPIVTNLGQSSLQVVMRQPVWDGGARKSAVSRAEAQAAAASARYRISKEDVDLEVRTAFSEVFEVEAEIDAHDEGLERLRNYRTSLRSRQAAGQGVTADLLKTDVRVAAEEADLLEARRRLDEARMTLNDLLGRDPLAALVLAPLAPPAPPTEAGLEPWQTAPELAESLAETRAAEADLGIVLSERKPHVLLSADFGFLGSDTTHLIPPDLKESNPDANFGDRLRRDAGYSFTVSLSLPLWDTGGYKARVFQARKAVEQSRGEENAQRRHARLEWERAHAALSRIYEEIRILSKAAPDARDSYLESESRYRGGAATTLEVLDAHSASVETLLRLAAAVRRFHVVRAIEIRWGSR
ncbi:MAG: TolC family protein [Thermoanaerobaculia bacterium]